MARGKRSARSKARKPAKRARAAARKPAKRRAAKPKSSKMRAKAPVKRAVKKKQRAKKPAPQRPRKLEVDVVEVETIEEVAPGVAVVTDYEIVGVRPATEKKNEEPGS